METIFANELDTGALVAGFSGHVDIIRVKQFYPEDICRQVAERMNHSRLLGQYENAPDISRIGRAYFEKQASAAAAADYEQNAMSWMRELRQAVSPFLPPVDKLRLSLDEAWPAGAKLASIEGAKAFAGLTRKFGAGSEAEPHQDVLAWDVAQGHPDGELAGQFAANIYLHLPPVGGELTIWPLSFSREVYDRHRRPGSYGLDYAALNAPPVTIEPELGELILFNSRLVHAVQPSAGGDRMAASCFIGFRSKDDPLTVWS